MARGAAQNRQTDCEISKHLSLHQYSLGRRGAETPGGSAQILCTTPGLALVGYLYILHGFSFQARGVPCQLQCCDLLSLAKYRVVRVDKKSGSRAAALQIATSEYYAGLSGRWELALRMNLGEMKDDDEGSAIPRIRRAGGSAIRITGSGGAWRWRGACTRGSNRT